MDTAALVGLLAFSAVASIAAAHSLNPAIDALKLTLIAAEVAANAMLSGSISGSRQGVLQLTNAGEIFLAVLLELTEALTNLLTTRRHGHRGLTVEDVHDDANNFLRATGLRAHASNPPGQAGLMLSVGAGRGEASLQMRDLSLMASKLGLITGQLAKHASAAPRHTARTTGSALLSTRLLTLLAVTAVAAPATRMTAMTVTVDTGLGLRRRGR